MLKFGEASRVVLADLAPERALAAAARVNALLGTDRASGVGLDVTAQHAVLSFLEGVDAFLSAVPYYHNLGMDHAGGCAGGRQYV